MKESIIIDINVPNMPKLRIYCIFLMKLFFFKVKPAANIIGGRITKKKDYSSKVMPFSPNYYN